MTVKILKQNKKIEIYEDIRKCYNLSTKLNTDSLCLEKYTDNDSKPSVIVRKDDIICFMCEEEIRGGYLNL